MAIANLLGKRERRRKRWPSPLLSLSMLVVWLLLNNTISFGHFLLGGFLAWFIPYITQSFWVQSIQLRRPLLAVRFVLKVLMDIVIANWLVAKMILESPKKLQPAFMVLPLDLEQDFTITLLANTISLTPGTVSADFNIEGHYLLVHALHVDDPEAAVAQIKQRYEAPLKEIFECSTR